MTTCRMALTDVQRMVDLTREVAALASQKAALMMAVEMAIAVLDEARELDEQADAFALHPGGRAGCLRELRGALSYALVTVADADREQSERVHP